MLREWCPTPARRLRALNERKKKDGASRVCEGRHTRQRRIVDVGAHRSARKPITQLVLTLFQMSVPSLDVMADEGQDPRDDICEYLAGGGIVD
jgi:hypothetical protein